MRVALVQQLCLPALLFLCNCSDDSSTSPSGSVGDAGTDVTSDVGRDVDADTHEEGGSSGTSGSGGSSGGGGSSGSGGTAGTAGTAGAGGADAGVPVVFPGGSWEQKSPEDLSMDSSKLDAFVDNVGGSGVVIKDGYLVRSWGSPSEKFDWASAAKPVLATMLFFAVHEGKLTNVDDPIGVWGWNLRPDDQSMTFRHLADMTSGYARGEAPGQAWAYNDVAIKLYAVTLFDRVFQEGSPNTAATSSQRLGALQFEDGSIFGSREGYGVETSPRDFARIGWFWLNRGRWNTEQLLPKQLFDDHMRPDVPGTLAQTTSGDDDYLGVGTYGGGTDQAEYGPGIYGFNWWFNAEVGTTGNSTWPDAPQDTFQANGHWNREVVTIIPSLGLVVAARGSWDSGQNTFAPGDATWGMNTNLKLLAEAASP